LAVKERVFNNRARKVFRKRIPRSEITSGLFLLVLLILAGVWFASRKNAYDPAERDLSMEALVSSTVEDTLYRTPLQRWVEPGSVAAVGGPPSLGVFPEGILYDGWRPSSGLREFDADTLYEKINGAAEQYIQFGFERLYFISLAKAGTEHDISVEMYDMGSFENALGIFAAQRDATRSTERLGPANYYPTEAGAVALLGPYYLKLFGTSNDTVIQQKAIQLVAALGPLAEGEGSMPPAYSILADGLGLPFDAIAYEKTDVFQFSFAKDFWFGVPPEAPDARYFVHTAADEAAAADLLTKLIENNKYDYVVVIDGEEGVLMKHAFLETYMTLSRRGRHVFGVENAPDDAVAAACRDKLAGVLHGEAEGYPAS